MIETSWAPVRAALDRAADEGRTLRVWLRDDDAVTVTPALERLATLCAAHGMPILLAVIPEPADDSLAAFCANHPHLTPTQHGLRHANHAPPGEKARELGGLRGRAGVLADLQAGREALSRLFGPRAADILVPPWNRIDDEIIGDLNGLGFEALSTFGPPPPDTRIVRLNCDLDPIDWRNGRVCRPHGKLIARLAELIADRTKQPVSPIGVLTHHLAHDAAAWGFLEAMLTHLGCHPAVNFAAAERLIGHKAVNQIA